MYDNSEQDNDNVTPYRASGNLNTSIGIPHIDVNDPMNMNIQSVNTNNIQSVNTNNIQSNVNDIQNVQINSVNTNQSINPNVSQNVSNDDYSNAVNNNISVKRNFISNKTKKKRASINLGPEFKMALLIIVVLLVFIFLLPVITSLFSD